MARRRRTGAGHIWEDSVWFRRADGSRYQRYVYGRTRAELAEAKGKLLRERRTRPAKRTTRDDDPTRWTLARLGEKWISEHVSTLTENTQDYYRRQLAHRVAPYLYEDVVGKLRKRDIIAWRAQ